MKKEGTRHSVDAVFVLSLFCVFAAAILLTLILGTKTHKAMKTASDEAFYSRTALSYISEKLRQCDSQNSITVGEFAGSSALFLSETYNQTEYETIIYLYDGAIRELFREEGTELAPTAGASIIAAQDISFSVSDKNLMRIAYIDPDGNETSSCVWLRSGGAG